jgi:methylthioribose-1-phosphate isomerase
VIEERAKEEVTKIAEKKIAPTNIKVINPAFDITPPDLITSIITEKGLIFPPYKSNIKLMMNTK